MTLERGIGTRLSLAGTLTLPMLSLGLRGHMTLRPPTMHVSPIASCIQVVVTCIYMYATILLIVVVGHMLLGLLF